MSALPRGEGATWVAASDDPIKDRQLDHKAITVKELCSRYLADLQAGLILVQSARPKTASTVVTDNVSDSNLFTAVTTLYSPQAISRASLGHSAGGDRRQFSVLV
jgi:hypothetical protein